MWDLPWPGLEPVSPALADGFLTTAPPGKPQQFDIFIHYEIITTMRPATIHHHIKLLQYYWLHSLCVHYIPLTYLFYSWKFVPLNPLRLFPLSPHTPSWQPPVCSLYLWVCFCFILFVPLFCFLDSTYKWNMVFVFLWLISLIPARSIHVATDGKISFFFMVAQHSPPLESCPFNSWLSQHLFSAFKRVLLLLLFVCLNLLTYS